MRKTDRDRMRKTDRDRTDVLTTAESPQDEDRDRMRKTDRDRMRKTETELTSCQLQRVTSGRGQRRKDSRRQDAEVPLTYCK